MLNVIKRLIKDEEAQGLGEYGGIMVIMIVIVVTLLTTILSPKIKNAFTQTGTSLDTGASFTP